MYLARRGVGPCAEAEKLDASSKLTSIIRVSSNETVALFVVVIACAPNGVFEACNTGVTCLTVATHSRPVAPHLV